MSVNPTTKSLHEFLHDKSLRTFAFCSFYNVTPVSKFDPLNLSQKILQHLRFSQQQGRIELLALPLPLPVPSTTFQMLLHRS